MCGGVGKEAERMAGKIRLRKNTTLPTVELR